MSIEEGALGKSPKPKTPSSQKTIKPVKLVVDGRKRSFDIENPKLPDWIDASALSSGNYPYDGKMPKDEYKDTLEALQIELVKLQYWLQETGGRVMTVFEGRDAAGKGGTIFNLRQYMNPRTARNVALTKPTEVEATQWYFQRYVAHFPSAGEFVTFDRSWYNRAGVEPVMGFCTPQQRDAFLDEVPGFERMIVADGIHFFKIWLNIGQTMQLKRFHDRRHSPLKNWKFSPMDIAGIGKWDDYTKARDLMIERTHTQHAPWTVVRANDKRRARIAVIRRILLSLPYAGRDTDIIGKEDPLVIGSGAEFF
ncbi:polyphosphate kinase 2 [Phyllobacterium sp. 21LDTY02-6]|uniref:polyphosphate kinase 2 n=1 Tax=Phyllobacterium sp. 21LDTY02-6 TaxID=2944903 RepID=UPI00202008EB|nr:polyphosphate kinase 2 [Phyllobacterium sp. 21LDTY02-6]MCO4318800.1 polyphosphate kinase 2 [Phyllobacterium sp. 21LDTY02-6]